MHQPSLRDIKRFAVENESCRGSRQTLDLLIERHGADAPALDVIFADLNSSRQMDWFFWLYDLKNSPVALQPAERVIGDYCDARDRLAHDLRHAMVNKLKLDYEDFETAFIAAKFEVWDVLYKPEFERVIRAYFAEIFAS